MRMNKNKKLVWLMRDDVATPVGVVPHKYGYPHRTAETLDNGLY